MSRLYLGIDGGQSSTVALIAGETGRVVGYGRGGPCNHAKTAEGRVRFFSAVGDCLREACAQAGLDSRTVSFASACFGFSGGGEDKESYSRELVRSMTYKITHDAEIALIGATAGEPGIIIIAGTGSMAFGGNAKGEKARAGGWGYIFGDEGSGFDLAREALRAALQYEEGWGPKTILRSLLLEETSSSSANELLHRLYAALDRSAIAAFATLVTQAAENGDEVARNILSRAAGNLTRLVEGVYGKLFHEREKVPVGQIGGVFRSQPVRVEFAERIQQSIGCETGPPRFGAAAGAVLEALRLDGNHSQLSDVPDCEK
jgi:N-acetylglucosamine kinase-like BadF-type ATPase